MGQTSQGITEMLSLYRASQVRFPGENILEEANNFSSKFLRRKQDLGQVSDRWLITKDLAGEVTENQIILMQLISVYNSNYPVNNFNQMYL